MKKLLCVLALMLVVPGCAVSGRTCMTVMGVNLCADGKIKGSACLGPVCLPEMVSYHVGPPAPDDGA